MQRTLADVAPTTSNTIVQLDLDWDLINHLASEESVKVLRAERLSLDVLEDDLAKKVFKWQLAHFREHGTPATGSVLEDEFADIEIEDPQTKIKDLIKRLRQRYAKNASRKAIKEMVELSSKEPLAVGPEMLRVGKSLSEISVERGSQYGTGDLERANEVYAAKVLRGPGPTLGFPELDEHFNGIQGITIGLAPPKTYKSWLYGVNCAIAGIEQGKYPYLYSLELPSEDTHWRILCAAANVPFWKYERGALDPRDLKIIAQASNMLDELGIYNVEKPPPGERSAQVLIERALAAGADYVIIDQLQYVENEKGTNLGAANDTGQYFETLSMLRDYSDDIPMMVVHQFNRSVMNSKEMPEMQQAKGSAAIEETAHLALGLWANKEMRKNNIVEIGTLASRSYSWKNWHVGVSLTKGCSFDMIGEVLDDEDEDE
jgi:replicative DNA helicase